MIGQEFEGWASQLNDIQRECRSLSELTLGQTQEAPVQFAFQLLKKAEDLMLASYDQYDHVFATFGELQRRLAELTQRHDQLMRTLLPINFVALSIRIEASRQPPAIQEVFNALAGNVCRTVNEVRSTLDRQFAELATSERIAGAVMGEVAASIQRHRQEVSATMKSNRAQLHALNEAIRGAGAGAADLAQLNQAISGHVGELVMAQQCQDITRQKIDHVNEAIDEMRAQMAEKGITKSQTCQFVYQAARIQLKQTQEVFGELNTAAARLEAGIQNLHTDGGAAAGVVVKVGETMLNANVAHQCEVSMGQIVVTIKQAVEKTSEILTALEPLQTRFLNCTQQATVLASDVRFAALNAQIFAIHAPQGATLEVLAGNIRMTSDETMEQVGHLGKELQHAAAMISDLQQRLTDFEQIAQFEQVILTEETEISQKKLLDLDKAIPVLIGRITQQQAGFAKSAEGILANIRFPAMVAAANGPSIGLFQDMVAWFEASGGGLAPDSAAADKIDRLRAKYTMASEQQTHSAAIGTTLDHAAADTSSVELFGEGAPDTPSLDAGLSEPDPAASKVDNAVPMAASVPTNSEPPKPDASPSPVNPGTGAGMGDNVELF